MNVLPPSVDVDQAVVLALLMFKVADGFLLLLVFCCFFFGLDFENMCIYCYHYFTDNFMASLGNREFCNLSKEGPKSELKDGTPKVN